MRNTTSKHTHFFFNTVLCVDEHVKRQAMFFHIDPNDRETKQKRNLIGLLISVKCCYRRT